MSTYPAKLVDLIYELRDLHEGWGATTILIELEEEFGYPPSALPCIGSVNRYLKQEGFIKEREPSSKMPAGKCHGAKNPHDLWEMDAQGAISVEGLGYVSVINMKDTKSKVHCVAFPVHVKGNKSQPRTADYFWAFRLGFEQWGLSKVIQVDKDSVFIDSTSKSPFPSRMHLFLIGLDIELCFIDVPPPQKQSMVERSHQTIERQAIKGQTFNNWQELFKYTNKRRKRMNEKLPNRLLDKKPPLTVCPEARHSGRFYSVETEKQLIDMKRIYKYLAKCCWFRKVSKVKTISLNRKIYYLKNAEPGTQLQIRFCNRSKKLIFRDAKELIVAKTPIKEFSIETIMGGTTRQIISTKKKLFRARDFPLKT